MLCVGKMYKSDSVKSDFYKWNKDMSKSILPILRMDTIFNWNLFYQK